MLPEYMRPKMQLLLAKSNVVMCLATALAIAGCNKNPPPGRSPAEGSAALENGHGPRELPKEAYTACEGKNSGDACSVKFGEREQTGKCEAPPQGASDTRLSCRPERPERKPE
jgi:hypothetical protein